MSARRRRKPSAAMGFVDILIAWGMSRSAAEAKCGLFRQCLEAVAAPSATGGKPYMLFVPGRIEVLGKHTDYAGEACWRPWNEGFAWRPRPATTAACR